MPEGVIKRFNQDNGYGFIKPDQNAEDVFVHRRSATLALGKGSKPSGQDRVRVGSIAASCGEKWCPMTFDEAVFWLQRQSAERGLGGRLADFSVALCEDRGTISIWALHSLEQPLMASFDLPAAIADQEFDTSEIMRRLEQPDASEMVLH